MANEKSHMAGMMTDYRKMYDVIKNWGESGGYIRGMSWAIGNMESHGWSGAAAANERYHYGEVCKAYEALKIALQNAIGIGHQKEDAL